MYVCLGSLWFVWRLDESCALLGYYAASSGNPLPTFRDNVSVPSSRVKKSKKKRRRFGTTYLSHLQGSKSPTRKEDVSGLRICPIFKGQEIQEEKKTFRDDVSVPSSTFKKKRRRFGTTYLSHLQESRSPRRKQEISSTSRRKLEFMVYGGVCRLVLPLKSIVLSKLSCSLYEWRWSTLTCETFCLSDSDGGSALTQLAFRSFLCIKGLSTIRIFLHAGSPDVSESSRCVP
jgi:hypothetical protein